MLFMTTGEALKTVKAAAKAGQVFFRFHANERQAERKVTATEILHALTNATGILDQRDGTWKVTGPGLAGKKSLTVIVAIENGIVVITVWRNFR
jgi:hypothetical protein